MAAKAAGVSFAETNAAIQVLDKAGKKGSEGGVALRNVMSTLAQGRFLPKDVRTCVHIPRSPQELNMEIFMSSNFACTRARRSL